MPPTIQESVRLEKRPGGSPFAKYRGYLEHLAGQDPDQLVEQMHGE